MDRYEVDYERCSLRWKGMKRREIGCVGNVGKQANKSNARRGHDSR